MKFNFFSKVSAVSGTWINSGLELKVIKLFLYAPSSCSAKSKAKDVAILIAAKSPEPYIDPEPSRTTMVLESKLPRFKAFQLASKGRAFSSGRHLAPDHPFINGATI